MQQTLPAIASHTSGDVPVVIAHEPTLNVSECRQKWMDLAETRYVYFMDVDSIITQDEWLEIIVDILEEHQAGAVTCRETWKGVMPLSGKPCPEKRSTHESRRLAGAGTLYDRDVGAFWDPHLGETYGYIGRELEDVDFAHCIKHLGRAVLATSIVTFDHAWHDAGYDDTDEVRTWPIISSLIQAKWKCLVKDGRGEFFRLLHPQPTSKFEKNHDFDGVSFEDGIRAIFTDLVGYWGGDVEKVVEHARAGGGIDLGDLFNGSPQTPAQRGVEDIWSSRYREVKPRSPK